MPWSATTKEAIAANARSGASSAAQRDELSNCRFAISTAAKIALRASRFVPAIARPLGSILIVGAALAVGPLLSACAGSGSTTTQGAVIVAEHRTTGIYSGREWDAAKRYAY
ncbi:MAG TPA: hypothetical protein VJR47_20650 [Stellaceae bacterium]|nr:hypothetical protein [Stellaceae bacterium]